MIIKVTNQQVIQLQITGYLDLDNGERIFKSQIVNPHHLTEKEPVKVVTSKGRVFDAMKGKPNE